MADAADSKSASRKGVPVQVRVTGLRRNMVYLELALMIFIIAIIVFES